MAGALGHRQRPARRGIVPAHDRRVVRRGARQRHPRQHRGVGAGEVPLPGPPFRGRADRSAVRATDRRRRHHPHEPLRAERLVRTVPRAVRDSGRVQSARDHHRADLHRPALRRPHASACHRRSRRRARGSGDEPRREPGAGRVPRDPALSLSRVAHRLRDGVRARDRRVRLRRLHRGQHADEDRDRLAADHHPADAVRLHGRGRDRVRAADAVVPAAARPQRASRLEREAAGVLDGVRDARTIDRPDGPDRTARGSRRADGSRAALPR